MAKSRRAFSGRACHTNLRIRHYHRQIIPPPMNRTIPLVPPVSALPAAKAADSTPRPGNLRPQFPPSGKSLRRIGTLLLAALLATNAAGRAEDLDLSKFAGVRRQMQSFVDAAEI